MAQTDDPHLKVVPPGDTGEPVRPEGEQADEADDARARSLQLGGGVPGAGIFGKYVTFLGEVRDEMRKVTWPTRKMVVVETIVVIAMTIFFTLLITGMDKVFATIFNWLLFGNPLPWNS